jgi:ABC-2 type transport system ATP-binding protein
MVGLDPVAIKMVKNLFKRLAVEGAAIFMSTHTLQVAEDVCDHIGVIHKGALLATGTTDELKRNNSLHGEALEDVFIKLTTENS